MSAKNRLRVGGMLIVGLAMLVGPGRVEAAKKATVTITGEVVVAEKRGDKVVLVFIKDADQGDFVVLRGTELGKEMAKLVGQEVHATGYTGKALRERKFERYIDVLEYRIVPSE